MKHRRNVERAVAKDTGPSSATAAPKNKPWLNVAPAALNLRNLTSRSLAGQDGVRVLVT